MVVETPTDDPKCQYTHDIFPNFGHATALYPENKADAEKLIVLLQKYLGLSNWSPNF